MGREQHAATEGTRRYGQLAAPLAASLAVAGVTVPVLSAVLAIILGFLAHEPLLVLLGGRGTRARREDGIEATRWLMGMAGGAAAAGALAVWHTAPEWRWGVALPLLPACVVAAEAARGRDKGALAELCVALTFSFAAVPVCLAAGASPVTGFSIALPFAVIFTAATLAVRSVTLAARGVDARVVAGTRAAAFLVALGGTAALAWACGAGLLPWPAAVAAVPGAAVAAVLALVPMSARRLRTIGWMIMAAAVLAVAVLAAG